jgi:hypothetical protein
MNEGRRYEDTGSEVFAGEEDLGRDLHPLHLLRDDGESSA